MAVISARGTITSEILRSVKAMRFDIIDRASAWPLPAVSPFGTRVTPSPPTCGTASRDGVISDLSLDHRPGCPSGDRGDPWMAGLELLVGPSSIIDRQARHRPRGKPSHD